MHDALAFSRASTGLYALFVALRKRDGPGEVVLPTLCCENVALAVRYAGHTLRFCDVSAESLCMTPETLNEVLSEKTRAVVLIHLYGVDAKVPSFDRLRRAWPRIAFIEDIAHAIGGRGDDGRMLGGGLDYALASFAESKIVPGDGGVLLFGPDSLAPGLVSAEMDTTADRVAHPRLALSLRNLVHGISDLWREENGRRSPAVFPALADRYRKLIVAPGGIADTAAVARGIVGLEANRAARYAKYVYYAEKITADRATIPRLHAGSNCWRCPLIFPTESRAAAITASLRAAGIPASNHYFPLSALFDAATCPVGEDIGLRIVNLWVDEDAGPKTMNMAIDIINQD